MDLSQLSLTTITLFLPMVGFTILLLLNGETQKEQIKWTAFGTSIVTFIASLIMWINYDPNVTGLQMEQVNQWLSLTIGERTITSSYHVGVDGISMLLVLLTTFIMPIAILSSFRSNIFVERGREKLYYALMLLLEWAMLGVFVVQDLIIFYIFWEVTLVPMYFLIGIWGGEQRVYASVKFFLYTMAGSILMLVAILFIANQTGTFTLAGIYEQMQASGFDWGNAGPWLFAAFFVAFAIKVPIFPFHSWLPDAHVQAPTAGSVILAGVLLKMGTYGLVRFNLTLFPIESADFAPLIALLGVIGIIYGAWVSYAQTDVKKLVAYSSVSHLGFVVLGIFALNAQGLEGATLQMVSHGISTGGLFLMVGILYERYHTKAMDAFGGVWKVMPVFGGISLIITLSSMGLPGLNGFVGEFTILLGSIGSDVLPILYTVAAAVGIILAAAYLLKMFQAVYMGEFKEPHDGVDSLKLHWNEIVVLIPIIIMIFWIGLQPAIFFGLIDGTSNDLIARMGEYIPTVAMLGG